MMKVPSVAFASFVLCAFAAAPPARAESFQNSLGTKFSAREQATATLAPNPSPDFVHRWNQIAINATGVDHTPVAAGEHRVFGEQLGPGRASRAMAIVHIAIADSVAASRGGFNSYTGLNSRSVTASMDSAVAQAAHDTLVA
ncbi:MAG: chloroperoxidase, partial [Verrucomicrobiota bacterium]|nr:chloroperoxidase [Verrucomicrobiota bacterium]